MPNAIAHICVTTNTAAAVATLTATATAWIMLGKPDIGMTLNGCLAGLVAITASCAYVSTTSSAIIGAIAGVLVVFSVLFFDRIKADDPVGATSVHLANGVFGTLCVGLFAEKRFLEADGADQQAGGLFFGGGTDQLMLQIKGIVAHGRVCRRRLGDLLGNHQGHARHPCLAAKKSSKVSTTASTATKPTTASSWPRRACRSSDADAC